MDPLKCLFLNVYYMEAPEFEVLYGTKCLYLTTNVSKKVSVNIVKEIYICMK